MIFETRANLNLTQIYEFFVFVEESISFFHNFPSYPSFPSYFLHSFSKLLTFFSRICLKSINIDLDGECNPCEIYSNYTNQLTNACFHS